MGSVRLLYVRLRRVVGFSPSSPSHLTGLIRLFGRIVHSCSPVVTLLWRRAAAAARVTVETRGGTDDSVKSAV